MGEGREDYKRLVKRCKVQDYDDGCRTSAASYFRHIGIREEKEGV